jgi:catechol 2,3-dioxygenase-like lactoylglutathione lyase family enzyme
LPIKLLTRENEFQEISAFFRLDEAMNPALYFLCGLLAVLSFNPHTYSQQSTGAGQVATGVGSNRIGMIKGVDNIGLCVTDLRRAVGFYQDLGFSKAYENDRGVTMIAGTAKLFVFQTRRSNPAPVERDFTLFQNPLGIDHISFEVEDVDRVYAEGKAKGLVFNGEPADQSWGARMVSLRDPDGNNLYLLKWLKK